MDNKTAKALLDAARTGDEHITPISGFRGTHRAVFPDTIIRGVGMRLHRIMEDGTHVITYWFENSNSTEVERINGEKDNS